LVFFLHARECGPERAGVSPRPRLKYLPSLRLGVEVNPFLQMQRIELERQNSSNAVRIETDMKEDSLPYILIVGDIRFFLVGEIIKVLLT